jgi:hypothetical protein
MATKIVTKNSSTASAVPTASDLVQGELAVNVADKRLFTEDNAGAIVELGTNPSTIDINAGTIDGTAIGASSASTGAFTTLTASGAFTSRGIDDNADATAITIDSSENVGIGTSSPSEKLTVDAQAADGSTTTIASFHSNEGEAGDTAVQFAVARSDALGSGRKTFLNATGAGNFEIQRSGTTVATIDGSGNVGIGTSSPTDALVVEGDVDSPQRIKVSNTNASGKTTLAFTQGTTVKSWLEFDNTTSIFDVWQYTNNALRFGTNNTERMRIDASGNVGIGTSSPSYELDIQSSSGDAEVAITGSTTNNAVLKFENVTSNTLADIYADNSKNLIFRTNSTIERMRIDSSGNLLVGTTDSNVYNDATGTGTVIQSNGIMQLAANNGTPLYANRQGNDGDIIDFRKDGTTVGSIGTEASALAIGHEDTGIKFAHSLDAVLPFNLSNYSNRDNAIDLGYNTVRFDDIYATNGTIQTSDRNEKQDIAELSDAEQRVAVAAKGLLRKFRWKDSVAEKGDDARIHFGIIAQDLQAAFEAEGLDAGDYAMFISTTWTDEETNEEKTRMGVRYSELLAFIISAI